MDHSTPAPALSLTKQLVQGDRAVVDELIRQNLSGLYAFVRLRAGPQLRQHESCADLVQSVCREVLEDLDHCQFDTEAAFRFWLYQAAERKIIDRARYWKRARRDPARSHPLQGDEEAGLSKLYASFATPSANASLQEEIERLESSMDALTVEQREVVIMAQIVGLSRSEIAERTERSAEAVSSLLYRAMARLSTLLQDWDDSSTPR